VQNAAHLGLEHPETRKARQRVPNSPRAVIRMLLSHLDHCLTLGLVACARRALHGPWLRQQTVSAVKLVARHPARQRRVGDAERPCHRGRRCLVLQHLLDRPQSKLQGVLRHLTRPIASFPGSCLLPPCLLLRSHRVTPPSAPSQPSEEHTAMGFHPSSAAHDLVRSTSVVFFEGAPWSPSSSRVSASPSSSRVFVPIRIPILVAGLRPRRGSSSSSRVFVPESHPHPRRPPRGRLRSWSRARRPGSAREATCASVTTSPCWPRR
jgi:hypothetical protein